MLQRLFKSVAFAFVALGCSHRHDHQHEHHGMHHRFDDVQRWVKEFDDPSRDEWQRPDEVIAALKLSPNAVVADVGAGTGYFAVRLAKQVPQGKVFAADVEPNLVEHLRHRAAHEGLSNLLAVEATPQDPKLPEAVDLTLIVDTWHHIDDRVAYARTLLAHTKPGGRLAIVDYRPATEVKRGPPPQMRMSAEAIAAEVTAAGWQLEQQPDFLPEQTFQIFKR